MNLDDSRIIFFILRTLDPEPHSKPVPGNITKNEENEIMLQHKQWQYGHLVLCQFKEGNVSNHKSCD